MKRKGKPVRKHPAPKPRHGPKLPTLAELRESMPTTEGVAAIEGALDAVEKVVVEQGLTGLSGPAMRAVFGMILGMGISDHGGTTLEVDGLGPVTIRKADAQAVALKSMVDLTRVAVNDMLTNAVKTGAIKLEKKK